MILHQLIKQSTCFALLFSFCTVFATESGFIKDEYLHPDKAVYDRQQKLDPSNPYSAEVANETYSEQCRIPEAFSEVHESVEKEWNTPHSGYGFGKPITEAAIRPWNIDVLGDGKNLPPEGVGMTIEEGEILYQQFCGQCHGEFGEGNGHYLPLAGGYVSDLPDSGGPAPVKTIANYWPYAISYFDYIRRAMPFFRPNHEDIGDAGYLAITGYILFLSGLTEGDGWNLDYDTYVDSNLLRKINGDIPNQDNFFCDSRPDVVNIRCGLDGNQCPDHLVGDGQGNTNRYKEALIDPTTGEMQYNVKQRL